MPAVARARAKHMRLSVAVSAPGRGRTERHHGTCERLQELVAAVLVRPAEGWEELKTRMSLVSFVASVSAKLDTACNSTQPGQPVSTRRRRVEVRVETSGMLVTLSRCL
jgi:hypothetical protein